MGDLECYRSNTLHTRTLTITTYGVNDATIMVEGVLQDNRCIPTYSLTKSAAIAAGMLHDITIRLLLEVSGLTIKDMEVLITTIPREECRDTKESLYPLIGTSIAPGFTSKVKKNFSGPRGCAHQNALLLAMASSAVQGLWTHRAGRPITIREAAASMDPRFMIDTCWVWRKEGPLVLSLVNALDREKAR